jgi:hypothetical protein
MLRGFVGIALTFPEALRTRRVRAPRLPVTQRWTRRQPLSRGSPAWLYLTMPDHILAAAGAADAIREGPSGSAWFAHRDGVGHLTGIEMRGPAWRSFSVGGDKTLFRLSGGPGRPSRVTVCEAAIDALSLATIEGCRLDTLYTATAGGMGPATIAALQQLLQALTIGRIGTLIAATDADNAGRRYAARLRDMAT